MKKIPLRRGGLWFLHEARPQALLPVLFYLSALFPGRRLFPPVEQHSQHARRRKPASGRSTALDYCCPRSAGFRLYRLFCPAYPVADPLVQMGFPPVWKAPASPVGAKTVCSFVITSVRVCVLKVSIALRAVPVFNIARLGCSGGFPLNLFRFVSESRYLYRRVFVDAGVFFPVKNPPLPYLLLPPFSVQGGRGFHFLCDGHVRLCCMFFISFAGERSP